jgi:hypothetical protein
MIIDKNMDVDKLAERMGTDSTLYEAFLMRDLLIERGYAGADTGDIRDEVWEELLREVAQ